VSAEVQFRIGRLLRTPRNLAVTWRDNVATLTWTASAADTAEDEPSGYVLEAGTQPGSADTATINLGNVTSYSVQVPRGRYYVRVRAVNGNGQSDPTTDLTVAAPGAPARPTSLVDAGSGSQVDLRWTAPSTGAVPTGYVIEAGSAPGRTDIANIAVGPTTRFVAAVPPGVYYVRVRAINAQGPSDASNEIVVRR